MTSSHIRKHGELRGLASTLNSSLFEGRFGRMFRTLQKATFSQEALEALANAMVAELEEKPTAETEKDDEEGSISAGCTYLGQFIDHDLTFDPGSSLQKQNDPDSLVNFRTPRFDLDNLYGRGPDDQPYMFDKNGRKFIFGKPLTGSDFDTDVMDLQRNNTGGDKLLRRAIIGQWQKNDQCRRRAAGAVGVVSTSMCIQAKAIHSLETINKKWSIVFSSHSYTSTIAAVRAGLDITVLPHNMVPHDLQIIRVNNGLPNLDDTHISLLKHDDKNLAVNSFEKFVV